MVSHSARHVSAFNLAVSAYALLLALNLYTHSYQIVLALCFGSLTYGYSFSVTSTTLGQPSFFEYFNLSQDTTSPRYAFTNRVIGGLNGCFSGGGFFGALVGGWACDALGRKKTLLLATPIAILGGALQGGAVNIAMLLVGRILGGFAVGKLFMSDFPPFSRPIDSNA
jgi:MFS family permease